MPTPVPTVLQVDRLTTSQIAQFKREGFVVLPGVLDLDLCRQARDQMWETLATHIPRMKQSDPSTWVPFSEEEQASFQQPKDGGDPYCFGKGRRFFIRNGAEELLLDLAPRALWDVAEQLIGKSEVVWPAGLDASGFTTGPCLMTADAVKNFANHHVTSSVRPRFAGSESGDWPEEGTGTTEQLRVPKTGPVWINGQGTRGMYCTLPNNPLPEPDLPGAHAGEGLYDGRWGLQIAAYFDDLPPGTGGLHLWPRSHTRIWNRWEPLNDGVMPKFHGRIDSPVPEIKADTLPVDTHGPAGSVVLWHSNMLHMAGVNTSTDVIRQATLYAYLKTPESISDERAMANPTWGIWDDWSDEVRAVID